MKTPHQVWADELAGSRLDGQRWVRPRPRLPRGVIWLCAVAAGWGLVLGAAVLAGALWPHA